MNEFENLKYKIDIEKSIKSLYILKTIFSFLSEKQKLNLIIYNIHLQKQFDINIENYKKIRRIYKVGDRNGKGKEYDISTRYRYMIFEGEYLDGKRNGKGKEYYFDDKLEFEGEYLIGKRNGKGKEYYYDGELKFEGEYVNGNKWNGNGYNKEGKIDFEIKEGNGIGKEYNKYGQLEFEGEYLNGERNGKV